MDQRESRREVRRLILDEVAKLRLDMCHHTADRRRFPHGAPLKPKRYCDECIADYVVSALEQWGAIPWPKG